MLYICFPLSVLNVFIRDLYLILHLFGFLFKNQTHARGAGKSIRQEIYFMQKYCYLGFVDVVGKSLNCFSGFGQND